MRGTGPFRPGAPPATRHQSPVTSTKRTYLASANMYANPNGQHSMDTSTPTNPIAPDVDMNDSFQFTQADLDELDQLCTQKAQETADATVPAPTMSTVRTVSTSSAIPSHSSILYSTSNRPPPSQLSSTRPSMRSGNHINTVQPPPPKLARTTSDVIGNRAPGAIAPPPMAPRTAVAPFHVSQSSRPVQPRPSFQPRDPLQLSQLQNVRSTNQCTSSQKPELSMVSQFYKPEQLPTDPQALTSLYMELLDKFYTVQGTLKTVTDNNRHDQQKLRQQVETLQTELQRQQGYCKDTVNSLLAELKFRDADINHLRSELDSTGGTLSQCSQAPPPPQLSQKLQQPAPQQSRMPQIISLKAPPSNQSSQMFSFPTFESVSAPPKNVPPPREPDVRNVAQPQTVVPVPAPSPPPPQVLPRETERPPVLPSKTEPPPVLPSETERPSILPSETERPAVLPSETGHPPVLSSDTEAEDEDGRPQYSCKHRLRPASSRAVAFAYPMTSLDRFLDCAEKEEVQSEDSDEEMQEIENEDADLCCGKMRYLLGMHEDNEGGYDGNRMYPTLGGYRDDDPMSTVTSTRCNLSGVLWRAYLCWQKRQHKHLLRELTAVEGQPPMYDEEALRLESEEYEGIADELLDCLETLSVVPTWVQRGNYVRKYIHLVKTGEVRTLHESPLGRKTLELLHAMESNSPLPDDDDVATTRSDEEVSSCMELSHFLSTSIPVRSRYTVILHICKKLLSYPQSYDLHHIAVHTHPCSLMYGVQMLPLHAFMFQCTQHILHVMNVLLVDCMYRTHPYIVAQLVATLLPELCIIVRSVMWPRDANLLKLLLRTLIHAMWRLRKPGPQICDNFVAGFDGILAVLTMQLCDEDMFILALQLYIMLDSWSAFVYNLHNHAIPTKSCRFLEFLRLASVVCNRSLMGVMNRDSHAFPFLMLCSHMAQFLAHFIIRPQFRPEMNCLCAREMYVMLLHLGTVISHYLISHPSPACIMGHDDHGVLLNSAVQSPVSHFVKVQRRAAYTMNTVLFSILTLRRVHGVNAFTRFTDFQVVYFDLVRRLVGYVEAIEELYPPGYENAVTTEEDDKLEPIVNINVCSVYELYDFASDC